jgi:hypothetical protein
VSFDRSCRPLVDSRYDGAPSSRSQPGGHLNETDSPAATGPDACLDGTRARRIDAGPRSHDAEGRQEGDPARGHHQLEGHWRDDGLERLLAFTIDATDKAGNGVQLRDMARGTVSVLDSGEAVQRAPDMDREGRWAHGTERNRRQAFRRSPALRDRLHRFQRRYPAEDRVRPRIRAFRRA